MKYSAMRRARLASAAAALALLAMFGCGPKPKSTVKGTVTWAGQTLKMGTVVFMGADNQSQGSGVIDADGKYAVYDAPVGDDKVYITLPPRPMGPMGAAPPAGMAGMPADKQPGAAGGAGGAFNPRDYPATLPDKYKKAETTDVKFTVKQGENTFNIDLKP